MNLRLPSVCFLTCCLLNVRAVTVDNFQARIFTNAQGTLPYRLFIPTNYNAGTKYPIVLFLHGAGERGSDNRLQLTGQTGELVFASETNQLKNPSFMVAPQCPLNGAWADTTRRAQVLGLMNALQSQYSIDADRLYVTGLSLGGIGSWDYISQFPNMYAAAIPMSGSGDSSLAARIIQIPIWNFHAANDGTVNVSGSRTMISAIRRAGGNPTYTEYATGGHVIWTPAYNTPILMNWVYAQKRGPAATNAPFLRISNPTALPLFASSNIASLSFSGTASDGNGTVNLVTWTNYQGNTLNGTASGTSNWSVTNTSLNSSFTNFVLITGRGTSWYAPLEGSTTFNDTLTVIFPPVIVHQPLSQTADQGSTVSFGVELASNRVTPRYQWRLNGINIPGATNSALAITNVQFANAGAYSVQASNLFGAITSSNANLVVNRPPVADSQIVSGDEDTLIVIRLSASDPDGDQLTYHLTSPNHGALEGTAPNLAYRPFTNYNGPDSFSFSVNDGRLESAVATVNIAILPVNDAPIAQGQSVTLDEDTAKSIILVASDVDGDALAYTVTQPSHGTLSGTPPNLLYQPATNYFGADSFAFKVSDGRLESALVTVSISVSPVNDAPFAVAHISPLLRISADQTNLLILSGNNSNALVVLDGSLSSDVENDPLQYFWFENQTEVGRGVLVTNVSNVGSHQIELIVSDGIDTTTNTLEFDVITPADAVARVVNLVQESQLGRKNKQPLIASLKAAMASFERANFETGINQLQAFRRKVRAQIALIDPAAADAFRNASWSIIGALDTILERP